MKNFEEPDAAFLVMIRLGGTRQALLLNDEREHLHGLDPEAGGVSELRRRYPHSVSVDDRQWDEAFGDYDRIEREQATVYFLRK